MYDYDALLKGISKEDLENVDQHELLKEVFKSFEILKSYKGMNVGRRFANFDEEGEKEKRDEVFKKIEINAGNLLYDEKVLKKICKFMDSVSDDIGDIVKAMIGALVSLTVTGQITIVWNPIIIASVCMVISRAGVKSVCSDYQ